METVLSTLVKNAGSEVQQAMLTLVCLSQSQPHFPTKSAALVDLMALPNALAYMAAVTKAYKSIAFFRALFASLLAHGKTEQILALLSHPDLVIPHETVQMVATELLSAAMDASDADAAVTTGVFQRLQGRYSRVLDAAVADFVAARAGDKAPKQDRKRVFHVVKQCLGGTLHALLEDLGTTLFLGLRHPEDAYCFAAVRHLKQNPTILANLVPEDVEPLAESLVAALDRDGNKIAATVLETEAMVEFLAKCVGNEFVHAVIKHALKKPSRPAVAAVARVNATWAAGLTDASRQAATLFLIHAGATHAGWLKEKSLTAPTAANDHVAALLATPEYAMTGLGLVTNANQTALFPAIVALIHDDREKVSTAAVLKASAVKGTDMKQRVLRPKQDRKRVFHVVKQCLGGTSHALLEDLAVRHLKQNPTILANLVPEDVEPLAESLVAALDRDGNKIAATVLETEAMVEFLAKCVGNEFVHAVIKHALKKPSRPAVAAVARVNATWAAGLTDASRQAATLFLIHAGATHAGWLKEKSLTAPTAANDHVAALLATPEYAMTGLGLVTNANQTALFPAIVALIHDDREKVSTAAVLKASAVKGTDMKQRVLCELFALPAIRLAKYTGQVQALLQGKNAHELLVGGLAHETPAVVEQCLKHLARLVAKPSAPTDFQALIPHVFPCFMHAALSVRQHARQVLVAVLKHYKTAAAASVSAKDEAGSKKKKFKYQLTVFPPVGYAANAVLFVEPKAMHDWLVEVTETTDLTTSHEAVLHQTYRKKKRQVLTAFLSHMPHLRVALLAQWLKLLSLVDSPDVFLALHLHFRKRHAMLGLNSTQEDVAVIIQFIHCITPGVASQILQSDSLDTFKQFLNGYMTPDLERVQQATLTRITPDLFLSLSGEQQYELLYILLNIVSKSQVSDVVLEAKSVLKRIPIAVHSLVQLFHKFHKNKDGQQGGHNAAGAGSNKRAANAAGGSGGGMPVRQRMSKLTSLLELISYKEVPGNDKLVQPLFSTLQYILNHPDYTQYDYIIQLVLADLLLVNKAALDESVFRIDLLVTCIRSTDNPQTHNSVLLVLSSLAALCPEKVLLHVMPIFTFMGAHVLRQDDEYTFNVIESTIEKIIPSLLLNVTHIKHVIQVFVDAIQHIPIHRRLRLFTTLIKTLGDQYLHAIIALLLEKEHVKLLEFCLLISSEFPVEGQLKATIELVRMCCEETPDMDSVAAEAKAQVEQPKKRAGKRSANNKKASATNDDDRLISLESLAKIKPPVLMFIDENLMMRSFISSLSKAKVEAEVKLFVQELLTFVQRHATNKPVLRLAYGILDKVHHLLSLSTFISVISDLWRHPSSLIQKRAVTMFNDRVSHLSTATVQKYRVPLMATLPAVQWIFAERSADPEMVQLGLMALQQLCTHFAAHAQHTATFLDAVPTILGYLSSGTAAAVTASAFVCLSHFIAQLTQRMVKYLNKWMASLLTFMEANKHHPLNEISALTCVEQCVLHLHAFLPPFLPKVFACLFADRDLEATMANPQLDLLYAKMDAVAAQVASHMQMRHLLPALFNFTAKLVPGTNSVEHVVRFGKHVVAALKKDDIKQHHGDLFAKYFLVLLDQTPYTPTAIAALVDLVMKLNENLFKPMFGHMLRWLREQPQRRAAVFFHAQAYMFDHLKNLLVGYMALALDDALAVLNAAREQGADTTAAAHVLDALYKCALYDTAKVVEAHLEPVTAGVAATLVVPALAPAAAKALVQIAVTVARGDMFDDDEAVSSDMALDARRPAVGTLGTLFETIGEGYLVLLPETIPTIAECLEDEELETATATAVRQIEGVLGEPLQKYLQK
ncbi:hypothetical protein, variant [Allomyces macrogynus ATCC 38327]|nr:hypothetical protein, variant [Allomyces macrogynus ATCC 38327]|eukprot:KNE59450.1 hypothetical protein, variant [Allomyces macrogynus ATCC 38327]